MKNNFKMFSFFTEKRNINIFVSFIFVLILFLVPKNTYALDFSVNGNTYEVNDLETWRDYSYFNYFKDDSRFNGFVCNRNNTQYVCVASNVNDDLVLYSSSAWNGLANYNPNNGYTTCYKSIYDFASGTNYGLSSSGGFQTFPLDYTSWLSSKDIYTFTPPSTINDTIGIEGNFTYNDIECKYNTSSCVSDTPGGDTPGGDTEEVNSSYVLYFKTGLVLMATFILMVFFKWCFPMKGGKDKKC